MQHEICLASFNVRNLAPKETFFYENIKPYTAAEYEMKTEWIARQFDQSNADVIAVQEVFAYQALRDVMAKSRYYRNADCIMLNPDLDTFSATPKVALISRLPFAGTPVFHADLPDSLEIPLPGDKTTIKRFSRPVLQASLIFPGNLNVTVIVVHLKSKWPDFVENANQAAPEQYDMASLRSLIRRGAEALGIRHLITSLRSSGLPVIVMGDFNDFACATSTKIISGELQSEYPDSAHNRLYNCFDLQPGISFEEKTGLFLRGTEFPRIDHIYISEEFTSTTNFRYGRVSRVRFLQEHLGKNRPEFSDHGLLMLQLNLR